MTTQNEMDLPVNIEAQLVQEQIRLSFQQLPFVVFLPPVSGLILAFLLSGYIDSAIIINWLIVVFFCSSVLGSWILWSRKYSDNHLDTKLWARRLVVFSIIVGGAWGIGGYVLFASNSLGNIGLLFLWMYLPAASGTMISLAYTPLFYSSVIPMLLPLTVRCLVEGGMLNFTLAATTVIYAGCLVYFHTHIHRMLMDSIKLRYEKSVLLDEVTLGKEIAEQANIEKSKFLAAASHDLRQPLHAQTLFVAELKHRLKDPDLLSVVENLESSINSMSELFNALLDISKLETAKIQVNRKKCTLMSLLTRLETEFVEAANNKGLKLRIVPNDVAIYTDQALLGRILQNYVANAIRYTEFGSVIVCCRRQDKNIRIEVRDSGPGISEDKHSEIFKEFIQLHNPERERHKGLGLGLAIVSHLGKILDHSINVRSIPDYGSVFSVTVPLYENQNDVLQEDLTNIRGENNIDGIRVLVIDNEESIRIGMTGLLRNWGCSVKVANGLGEAFKEISQGGFAPQVIISDYRLPGEETGIDMFRTLKKGFASNALCVLITGDTAIEIIKQAQLCGIHVLHKPVALDKLKKLIGSVI